MTADLIDQYPIDAICARCNRRTVVTVQDCGIGPYEAWGQKLVEVNFQPVTECCGSYEFTEVYDAD